MIDLKKFDGPFGIPIYYQRMPEMINSVSLGWLIFTGAADDITVGSPGLHHWFEHVPFRGTTRFQHGVADIQGPFAPFNGYINAWTNHEVTNYYGNVHRRQWREALTVVTDLVANPLLTDEGIEAERRVIYQEINGKLSSAGGRASYDLSGILFAGHAFGHPVLGSERSLANMDATTLRRAHTLGYDRSRAVFICVGNIPEGDLFDAVASAANELPNHQLTERRKPAYFGPLPSWQPTVTVHETEFATSVVYMLFPTTKNEGDTATMTEVDYTCGLLGVIFEHGGLTSPLLRIVREEWQLVYGCSTCRGTYAGGGYFGMRATAKRENIRPIIQAFNDVLADQTLRSSDRLASIKSCLKAEIEMMPVDSETFRDKAISQFIKSGGAMRSYEETIDRLDRVTIKDVDTALATLRFEDAHVIIFEGLGKS